jgi:hypothetical protein
MMSVLPEKQDHQDHEQERHADHAGDVDTGV